MELMDMELHKRQKMVQAIGQRVEAREQALNSVKEANSILQSALFQKD
jgi:hypothetical protein